jgi:hypothetical protein
MEVLILEGWPASGKTALWAMLDGSQKIFVEPLHTYWFDAIFELFDSQDEYKIITIREFRKALGGTEYFKMEQYANLGYFPISFAANKQKNHPFRFDFYNFDRELIGCICDATPKSAGEILEIYCRLYIKYYQIKRDVNKVCYFASMSNYFMYKKNKIESFQSLFKIVVMSRAPIEIYASRLGRKPRIEDGENTSAFAPTKIKLFQEAELEEIYIFNHYWKKASIENPSRVHCCDLKNFLDYKEYNVKALMKFLKLSYADVHLYGTRDGRKIEDQEHSLTLSVNDKSKDLLLKRERFFASLRILIAKIHMFPVNVFSLISIVRYTYLAYKKLR